MRAYHGVRESGAGSGMNRAWVEDPHVLSAGKVRFLALTDMDWGDCQDPLWVPFGVFNQRGIASTNFYPRPWFGYYDAASKRLYPWGGYDPAIANSGFYYKGTNKNNGTVITATADPTPVNSLNPVTRVLDHWSVGQLNATSNVPIPTHPAYDVLYKADTPRALVNSDWRDCSIVFLSNGEVRWGYWMPTRHNRYMKDAITAVTLAPVKRGVFDRCNGVEADAGNVKQHVQTEAGNFDQDTGGWFITLAPDSLDDKDSFNSANEALASISPMYRVFISRLGEVKVLPVSQKPDFQGLTAFPPNAAWWRTSANMQNFFPADRYVNLGLVQGKPITTFVTPQMISERQVWMK